MSDALDTVYSPPSLAKRWKCKPSTILALLKSGRLKGFTLGAGRRRPRWRIPPDAVAAYELGQPNESTPARRRRKPDPNVIEFF